MNKPTQTLDRGRSDFSAFAAQAALAKPELLQWYPENSRDVTPPTSRGGRRKFSPKIPRPNSQRRTGPGTTRQKKTKATQP